MKEIQEILTELQVLVGEDLKSVSYKWLARHYQVPVNLAKQLLFSFAEQHRGKVNTTYLLAGWTKGSEQKHIIQLIDGNRLQELRKQLDPITCLHVYSVQPSQPKDPADLWNADIEQATALFDSMVKKMEQNSLSDNRLSAVICREAKRDPEMAKKIPVPPVAEEAASVARTDGVAAKIDGIMAGGRGSKKGVASASIALGSDGQHKDALASGSASAPAAVAASKPRAIEATAKPAAAKGKGSSLSNMWSKAPAKEVLPKKAAAGTAPIARHAVGAADAEGALRIAQQAASSSDDAEEEEDNVGQAKRKVGRQSVFEDSDSDAEQPAAKKGRGAAKKAGTEAPAKKDGAAILIEESDNDTGEPADAEPPKGSRASVAEQKAPAKRGRKKKADSDEDEDVVEVPGKHKNSSQKSADGSVKAGAKAGSKRRKVTRTVINEKGEEVTETVWEEETLQPDVGTATKEASPSVGEESKAASQETSGVSGAAKKAVEPAKPAAKKSSLVKGGKKSGPAAKGKAVPGPGQKKIMSFFQKK